MEKTKTIENWILSQEAEGKLIVSDITEHGTLTGINGITYHSEILDFFEEYQEDITEIVTNLVWDFSGYDSNEIDITVLMELNKIVNEPFKFEESDVRFDAQLEEANEQILEDLGDKMDEMDDYDLEELQFEYVDNQEFKLTDDDKEKLVWLAVEYEAVNIENERESDF